MDTTTLLAALVTLGVPGLILAIGYAIKKVADARLVSAEAMSKREEAKAAGYRVAAEADKTRADAEKTRADAEKADADTTGRIVVGREADAETIRNVIAELRGRLDRCEARHEAQEKRHEADREEWRRAVNAKDAQIDALWNEVRSLRTAIEGART